MKRHYYMPPDEDSLAAIMKHIDGALDGACEESGEKAWLVIGSIHHINGIIKDNENWNFLFLDMPPERFDSRGNSVYIPIAALDRQLRYTIRTFRNNILGEGTVAYGDLFHDMQFEAKNLDHIDRDYEFFSRDEVFSLVPLFYISCAEQRFLREDRVDVEVLRDISLFSQLRFSETDIIFIKTAKTMQPIIAIGREAMDSSGILTSSLETNAGCPGGSPLLAECVKHHDRHSLFLGNHQCYYRKMESEFEIEYKLNLDCGSRIWDLTVDIYSKIKSGGMPGYILEYKDEFQKWDYHNHLFEVTAPEEERGYISFIPRTDGKYNVKRKIYKQDDLKRRETIRSAVKIEGTLEDFLADEFGFGFKRYPAFRRVRYDINFESLRSGNVFGIFFDHVSVEGKLERLVQCEIEYLRTRSLFDNHLHMDELAFIYEWTLDYLGKKGISYTETYYSKLSFLRDICK